MVLIFWQLISLQGKIHLQNVICFLEDGFLIMCHILCTKKNNVLSCLTILLATNLEEKTQNIIIGDGNLIIVIFQGNKKKKKLSLISSFLVLLNFILGNSLSTPTLPRLHLWERTEYATYQGRGKVSVYSTLPRFNLWGYVVVC